MLDLVVVLCAFPLVIIGVLRSRLNRFPHEKDGPGVLKHLASLVGIGVIVGFAGCSAFCVGGGSEDMGFSLGLLGTVVYGWVKEARRIPAAKRLVREAIIDTARSEVTRVETLVDKAERTQQELREHIETLEYDVESAESLLTGNQFDLFWDKVDGAEHALELCEEAPSTMDAYRTIYAEWVSGFEGTKAKTVDWSTKGFVADPESTKSEVEQIVSRAPAFPQTAADKVAELMDTVGSLQRRLGEARRRAEQNINFVSVRQRREQLRQHAKLMKEQVTAAERQEELMREHAERQEELMKEQLTAAERREELMKEQLTAAERQEELLKEERYRGRD